MKKTYIYANSQILAQHDVPDNNAVYFYLHDRLGSVRLVIDDEGDVENSYTYNAFGESFDTETAENVSNPFKFTGQFFDDEIGQYYLRARQYAPQLMRFTSRDPVKGNYEEPMTLHRYLYCLNDPANKIDPLGELGEGLGAIFRPMVEAAYNSACIALGYFPETSAIGKISLALGTAEAGLHTMNILYIRSLQHILMNDILNWSGLRGAGDPLPVAWDLLFGKDVLDGWIQMGYEYWNLGVEWYKDTIEKIF